jgi:Spy/CpxP family protein refolding chaperone
MGRKLHLKRSSGSVNPHWNPDQALAEALAEKAEFLGQHPEYRQYQREIDTLMDKAGTPENRMTVLAMLMEGKLIELQQELKKLNGILLDAAA